MKIGIATLYYQNYKLSLLDRQGVFGKYRVDGLTVKNDALRYYDISSIFRAWDETIASLDGKEWVLRFYETEWKQLYNDWYTEWQWTDVSEVSILRLKFETAGKVYNLGVVDNKQTGDSSPDNNNTNEYDFGNWGAFNWLKYVLMIVAAVILILLLSPVLPYIVQAVVWVVMLPFKGIAALANAIKKAATKKPKTTANSPTKAVKAPQPKTVYVKSDKPKQGKEKQNK